MNKFWKEQIEDVKKKWVTFLLFGLMIIIINTIIQSYIAHTMAEELKGPPCRIYAQEIFNQSKENKFELPVLILNLRNEKLIVDKVDSYCYWNIQTTPKEKTQTGNNGLEPNSGQYIPAGPSIPQEPPSIKEYGSLLWRSSCKAPPEKGNFPIRIEAVTNQGKCETSILMVV